MCGIWGIVNGTKGRVVSQAVSKFAANAFVAGSLRGEDSTGVLQVDAKGHYQLKEAVDGATFITDKIAKRFISDADVSFLTVGHNRAATEGKVIKANAHPFTVNKPGGKDSISGVHNGTLNGWKSDPQATGITVDSEWAFTKIAHLGDDAFEKFYGSYCLAWADTSTPDKFYMARNADRPMHYAYNKEGTRMFFASEPGMLAWLAERNYITLEDTIYVMEAGYKYEFDVNDPKKIEKTKIKTPAWTSTTYTSENRYSPEPGSYFLSTLKQAIRSGLRVPTPTAPVVTSLTPTKKQPAVWSESLQSSAPNLASYIYPASTEEMNFAISDGIWNMPYRISLEMYDDTDDAAYGTVLDNDGNDTKEGVIIRNISAKFFSRLEQRNAIDCYAAGISYDSMGMAWIVMSLVNLNKVPNNKLPDAPDQALAAASVH